jgi:hypothetical protein
VSTALWDRPISPAGAITYTNYSNTTYNTNITYTTIYNVSANASLNLTNGTHSYRFPGTNFSVNITGDYTMSVGLFTASYILQCLRRNVQTYPGVFFADIDGVPGMLWDIKELGTISGTPKPTQHYLYDFGRFILNETYGEWEDVTLGSLPPGRDDSYRKLSIGFPWTREYISRKASLSITFKASGGSSIGYPCPVPGGYPNVVFSNITIGINSDNFLSTSVNFTRQTWIINSSMINYTTLKLDNVDVTGMNNLRAWIVIEHSAPAPVGMRTCFDLEKATIEQW